ncbi:hypothetical protein EDD85DRAFT_162034 [Armillaria nabsnona]|nr:hypothetical protein EDD85DRAFT_162034 [Armillaria nabsnona]
MRLRSLCTYRLASALTLFSGYCQASQLWRQDTPSMYVARQTDDTHLMTEGETSANGVSATYSPCSSAAVLLCYYTLLFHLFHALEPSPYRQNGSSTPAMHSLSVRSC